MAPAGRTRTMMRRRPVRLRRRLPASAPAALALLAMALLVPAGRAAGTSTTAGTATRDTTATSRAAGDSTAGRAERLPFALVAADSVRWPDGAAAPAGVAVDDFGRVYVSDAARHRLVRFDADGAYLGQAGALGSGEGRMRRPGSVATFGTLSVAVLDRENRRVLSYDLFGRLLGVLVAFEDDALESEIGRVDPVAMASDRGGAMYVADAERDRVLVFDFSGRLLRTLGGIGDEPGSFRGLRGVGASPAGLLVTAERGHGRVQRLEASGASIAAWPVTARAGREMLAVAADDSGRVALADEAAGTVRLFDGHGRVLAARDGFGGPRALAFARDGSLWIAEGARGVVRRWIVAPVGSRAGGR